MHEAFGGIMAVHGAVLAAKILSRLVLAENVPALLAAHPASTDVLAFTDPDPGPATR